MIDKQIPMYVANSCEQVELNQLKEMIDMGVKCRSIVMVRYQQEVDIVLKSYLQLVPLGLQPYINDQKLHYSYSRKILMDKFLSISYPASKCLFKLIFSPSFNF